MYDVICESVQPELPSEMQGADDRVIHGLDTYDQAQQAADDFIERFAHLPDVRVIIWDQKAQRSIVVHDSDA